MLQHYTGVRFITKQNFTFPVRPMRKTNRSQDRDIKQHVCILVLQNLVGQVNKENDHNSFFSGCHISATSGLLIIILLLYSIVHNEYCFTLLYCFIKPGSFKLSTLCNSLQNNSLQMLANTQKVLHST
jgi:hypothetical protein